MIPLHYGISSSDKITMGVACPQTNASIRTIIATAEAGAIGCNKIVDHQTSGIDGVAIRLMDPEAAAALPTTCITVDKVTITSEVSHLKTIAKALHLIQAVGRIVNGRSRKTKNQVHIVRSQ